MRSGLFILLLAFALILPVAPEAQNQSDGTLHVVRPSIDAEQDTAELCLEFDHAIDRTNPARILAGIHLEANGKVVPLALPNVNLGATSLCLQSLAHRQDYRLTVSDLHGAGGEKLTESYKLSFTVPDRHPALAFSGEITGHIARIGDSDPVLRAINVTRAKVSLFRLTDPAQMAEAFRQRLLTPLAPSESLIFAKDKAQLVWHDDLVLDVGASDKSANRNLEHPIPLHAAAGPLTPGLYLLVAEDAEPPAKSASADQLAPIAARWFLRSDIEIRALRREDGFSVETNKSDSTAVAKDVHLSLFNRDNKSMVESASDASGLGFLALAADKMGDAAVIIGQAKSGDVDFADLTGENTADQYILSSLQANAVADRPFYAPGGEATIILTARNLHGEAFASSGSSIELWRPDHNFYASYPVPDGKAGIFYASLPVPSLDGLWTVLWRQQDGRELVKIPLRVSSNANAPQFSMIADRPVIGNDGEVNISLKTTGANNVPSPFLAGRMLVKWTTPDTFSGWSDYHFGREENNDQAPAPIAAFVTDTNGAAKIHLNLKPPDDGASLHMAMISLHADPATGAFDPDALALPVRPNNYIVGIKPMAPDGKFAENSQAKFDVIVLDGDGKRREDTGLKYQVYEEGRSFAWYQAEGRWDYKQQQQRRRLGGGTFDIKADGANTIRWPVTSGAYVLEVTDTNGVVLVRLHFNAGWGLVQSDHNKLDNLALSAGATEAQPGTPLRIKFKLDRPAIITAIVADNQMRKIIHEARAVGDNQIAITPEDNWGNRVRIRIEAEQRTDEGDTLSAGQIELPVHHQKKEFGITADIPAHVTAGQDLTFFVAVNNIDRKQATFVDILATPITKDDHSFVPPSIAVRNIAIGADGKTQIRLPLPVFSGILRLAIIAANGSQYGQKEISVPVDTAFGMDLSLPVLLDVGDRVHFALTLQNNSAPADIYHYALSASPGLKLAGTLAEKENFPSKARHEIAGDLAALDAGNKILKLDMTGPRGFHAGRSWNLAITGEDGVLTDIVQTEIAGQQSWNATNGQQGNKAHAKRKPDVALIFVAGQPLFKAPQILPAFLASAPISTGECAAWLETMRIWRDTIVRTGFLSDRAIQEHTQDMLQRLLVRQKTDGGFPSLPGGESDLLSTADALIALARADKNLAKPASDAAASWLRQKLANTWFEESERNARAGAFAALAISDRLDVSSLRYFAETSDGKDLDPLAAAQLALALAKSNDQDKAKNWLGFARGKIESTPDLWPLLAGNPFFDPGDLTTVLEKTSASLIKNPSHDPQLLATFLQTVWIINDRAGNWHASINGADRNQTGVLVIAPDIKAPPPSIRNLTDRLLYVMTSGPLSMMAPAASASMTRRFYRPDGSESAANDLKQGNTYLVLLEGSAGNSDAAQLFVHDATESEMRPVSCALDAGTVPDTWSWLKKWPLTAINACETGNHTVDTVLALPSSDAKISWHIAYLVKAEFAGSFDLPAITARGPDGGEWMAGGAQPITIK